MRHSLLVLTHRRKVLHIWKEKQTFDATYRKLLRCVVAGKDHKTAKKICDLDIFKGTPLQRGNLGGSQGYQQPTGTFRLQHVLQVATCMAMSQGVLVGICNRWVSCAIWEK